MKSFFITGTDTDAGKTFVTAGIVKALRNSGIEAMPAKPVQSGCINNIASDLEFALSLCEMDLPDSVKGKLCPIRFEPACSPHLAAELTDTSIDVDEMVANLNNLKNEYKTIIAEGAGGVLVPVGNNTTMLDLMKKLNWPVILVVANKLGAINHALLSITVLREAGLVIAGVVINHTAEADKLIAHNNVSTIEKYGNVKILGKIPYSPTVFPINEFQKIAEIIKKEI